MPSFSSSFKIELKKYGVDFTIADTLTVDASGVITPDVGFTGTVNVDDAPSTDWPQDNAFHEIELAGSGDIQYIGCSSPNVDQLTDAEIRGFSVDGNEYPMSAKRTDAQLPKGGSKGADLITNGDFADSSWWNFFTGTSVSGGKCNFTVNDSQLRSNAGENSSFSTGKVLEFNYKVNSDGAGNSIDLTNQYNLSNIYKTTSNVAEEDVNVVTQLKAQGFRFHFNRDSGSGTGTVDDVVLQEWPDAAVMNNISEEDYVGGEQPPASSTGTQYPRTGTICFVGSGYPDSRLQKISQCDVAIYGGYYNYTYGGKNIHTLVNETKVHAVTLNKNGEMLAGRYINMGACDTNDALMNEFKTVLEANPDWWLKNTDTGNKIGSLDYPANPNKYFTNYSLNTTPTTSTTAHTLLEIGDRVPDWYAKWKNWEYFSGDSLETNANSFDFWFQDIDLGQPNCPTDKNGPCDWDLDPATAQVTTGRYTVDAEVMREGMYHYCQKWHDLQPNMYGMTNSATEWDISEDFDHQKTHGVLKEEWDKMRLFRDASLSFNPGGFVNTLTAYRTLLSNMLEPKLALLDFHYPSYWENAPSNEYQYVRYVTGLTMMDRGYVSITKTNYGVSPSTIYDEHILELGQRVGDPPTTAEANGTWVAEFDNGMVIVNPHEDATQRVVSIPADYRRFRGSDVGGTAQDAIRNDGTTNDVTLAANGDAVVLVKISEYGE